ncbi:ribosomal-protein-alanine N-acetyltransferase [Verminephrobacter aporrectodeae subsp. tuberculatae]|uniref:ribosomal protein S18-alanine N-acetyltransferase n=1 Tax=Verminephrobacter aporrectodeae TaxID=1110389 RepID=UPI0022446626|nr:ribosomal protein S18-alanine N-acetyltransferase [Verminephrobacter aporrectodeae]MCW8206871.1 ribosomal-protein-alanine N-acetyltransferase [Verminephrobacter aporrectodeae subsp. tuberculatae]
MSVQPSSFAAAPDACLQVHLEALTLARLDAVLAVEQRAYSHPWTRGNFTDALACDYQTQVLMAGEQMLGYFVAMMGVDEVHLLNITVVPEFQRQGWARMMLDALTLWARGRNARWIWLEVRVSNLRAQHVYQAYGFRRVGERKHYYPAAQGQREDALLMRRFLVDLVRWHSRGPE